VALHASKRGVLTVEERTVPRMSERRDFECPRRMARVARSTQLSAVDVDMTRLAIGPEAAKVGDEPRGRNARAQWHVLVARHTCEGRVLLRQRKSRREVIEFAFLESRLGVARGTILLELGTMRIRVAARARTKPRRDLRRRL
jgi:hypothetical protein